MSNASSPGINETHDPNLKSWVESANDPATEFPIQNLPFCTVLTTDFTSDKPFPAIAAAIGDEVLILRHLESAGLFRGQPFKQHPGGDPTRNIAAFSGTARDLAAWTPEHRTAVRRALSLLLRADNPTLRDNAELRQRALRPLKDAEVQSPVRPILNYTDFYASIHHASTVGAMFRPDNPLLPNYKWVPIGYHGRASSIVASGSPIKRPSGQQAPPDDKPKDAPTFGPCKLLDYELEVGCFIGPGNGLGEPITTANARDHIFGLCLVNDWSARDIQKWEYQPLGPFLAKNFATTISPYIVTLEALAPFRCPAYRRPDGDPRPLPYLFDESDQAWGGFDITLEAYIQSADMAKRGMAPLRLSSGRGFKDMYWTFAQMIAHHTSNGCNFQSGDLIASGTVSGPTPDSRGCLLELTWDGQGKPRRPIELPTGEKRTFLADGDTVIFKGYCERDGFRRIGFGECRGTVVGS
jgi:fumarylacetoacetase